MSRYTKLRELVTLTRRLEAEGRKMAKGSRGRADRMTEAEEYRLKSLWLAGRITEEQYHAGLVECLDSKAYAVD